METIKDLKIWDEVYYLNEDKDFLISWKVIYIRKYFFFFKEYYLQSSWLGKIMIIDQFNLFFKKDNNH